MKTSAVIRIILFSLAILLLSFILLSVLDQNYYIEGGRVHTYEEAEYIEPVAIAQQDEISAQIRNIEIEWAAGSITIQPDEHAQSIHVTEYAPAESKYQLVMKQSGQTLKIKFCEESVKLSSFGINADDVSKDLEIVVPAGWSGNSIEIDAAAADVEIRNLRMNDLDFDGASGKLVLDNCEIVDLDIDTASGDVEFTGTLKDLDFDAASAKFSGEFYQVPNQLNLDAISGDLNLVLPEYSGFYLELDTMSGSFDSDFDFHTTGAHYECGDGACKIKVSGMSGDVSILKGIKPAENCNH